MLTENPRKEKIRSLKKEIKDYENQLLELLKPLDLEEQLKLTPEEQEKTKQEWKTKTEVKRVEIDNLKEAMKQTRMNKYSSSFFEFTPTGPNRKMRRGYRKLKKV